MIKAIIFDCFGVVITDALQAMCDELAVDHPEKAARVKDLVELSIRGQITNEESNRESAAIFGLPSVEAYRARINDGERRNQPLLDYIVQLRKSYKTAMLSNVSSGGLLRRFKVDELEKYFDVTVASAEIGFAKPEAQAYEITADRLGVRLDECIFTDDREEYCEGARAVGMQAIRYQSFDQFKTDLETIVQAVA